MIMFFSYFSYNNESARFVKELLDLKSCGIPSNQVRIYSELAIFVFIVCVPTVSSCFICNTVKVSEH